MPTLTELVQLCAPKSQKGLVESDWTRNYTGLTHKKEYWTEDQLFVDFGKNARPEGLKNPILVKKSDSLDACCLEYPELEQASQKLGFLCVKKDLDRLVLAAVTGTNGKSTVVEFCRTLAQKTKLFAFAASLGTLGLKGGINENSWSEEVPNTTPFALDLYRLLKKAAEKKSGAVFLEASSHGLDQDRLAGLKFATGAFCRITRDHLDYHKSMEDYAKAKGKLLEQVVGPVAFLADCPLCVSLAKKCSSPVFYSVTLNDKNIRNELDNPTSKIKVDWQITELYAHEQGYTGKLRLPNQELIDFHFPQLGKHNMENVLAASIMLCALGANAVEVVKNWGQLSLPLGRLERVEYSGRGVVLIDYAHTPDAMAVALKTLKEHYPKKTIRVLFGCGGDRDSGKRALMTKIACEWSDEIILSSDNPRSENPAQILDQMETGWDGVVKKTRIDSRKDAIFYTVQSQEKNSVLLLAGKGHEKEQITKTGREAFDEREILKQAAL